MQLYKSRCLKPQFRLFSARPEENMPCFQANRPHDTDSLRLLSPAVEYEILPHAMNCDTALQDEVHVIHDVLPQRMK